ncbi:phosphoribosylglycinamide formyltransferase [Legionella anisa]|uniref:Phosphoribosylglycinamide formyltransferase n=1 Tax=Legionella anisa TaxID=28082 RepID=A0AAX0WPV3_9GAMM|nr:phosphoribosylglycinamide formyltransferase [Legionella anisa]AWN73005.1 phosphoribosylglycinamide formyltransferase [Legionella anisa]KTC70534.1 phosphoribosylglycinamide formyltransferase [Legionella anisa]MCW8423825.1 phosphoribosylglycinamide formyltransferase [Legionella anisa]MCW8447345.1 phosphoribosylglycinamide formyltransferase [Legionella anisa]PNL60125.1 phosphoribosylglycinamide formyltransferase [Legionella anisa]
MIRIAVLGSTRGTNLNTLVAAMKQQHLSASIELVLSNKADALILEKAARFGIKSMFVNPQGLSRVDFDHELSKILRLHQIQLVVLIGYMRILSAEFVDNWENKIINIHPSLLPAYAGLMNLDVHQAVIDGTEVETGCTVHFVTAQVDAGPIILQKKCPVLPDDTAEILKTRVQELEGPALVEAINMIAATDRTLKCLQGSQ